MGNEKSEEEIVLNEVFDDFEEITEEELEDFASPVKGAEIDDHIRKFLEEVGKVPPLSPEEEAELVRLITEGDEKAKVRLAEANLRLVVSIAKRYINRGILFLDLLREGSLGLIKAVDNFDHTKGYEFSAYATRWIHHKITRAIGDRAGTKNATVYTEGGNENISAENGKLLRKQLSEALEILTPREKEIIRFRFGIEDGRSHTLKEASCKFGISLGRIRQIEAKTLRKLSHAKRRKRLKDFLD